jgi:hypothetical protein
MSHDRDRPGPRRLQTANERDEESARARKDRARASSPAAGVEVDFDRPVTGVLSGEALREARGERPFDERLERLETSKDDLGGRVSKLEVQMVGVDARVARNDSSIVDLSKRMGAVEVTQGAIGAQLTTFNQIFPKLVDTMDKSIVALQQRETITLTTQLDVAKHEALDTIDERRDKRRDKFEENSARRKRNYKIVSGVVALLTSGTLIGYLITRIFG